MKWRSATSIWPLWRCHLQRQGSHGSMALKCKAMPKYRFHTLNVCMDARCLKGHLRHWARGKHVIEHSAINPLVWFQMISIIGCFCGCMLPLYTATLIFRWHCTAKEHNRRFEGRDAMHACSHWWAGDSIVYIVSFWFWFRYAGTFIIEASPPPWPCLERFPASEGSAGRCWPSTFTGASGFFDPKAAMVCPNAVMWSRNCLCISMNFMMFSSSTLGS